MRTVSNTAYPVLLGGDDICIVKGVGMITIYKCDWCGEAFDYEDQCEEHEETCEARKREEDLVKLARWKKTFGEVKA